MLHLVTGAIALSLVSLSQQSDSVPLYDNLGSHHYNVGSETPLAQRFFDQGLRLYYAFNHAEAIRAFRRAASIDGSCAMCHWGVALALGPNINMPMDSAAGTAAYETIRQAQAVATSAPPKQRAFIAALAHRYAVAGSPISRAVLDSAYARAMGSLVQRYPTDVEARTLYAEALMNLSPWNYWTKERSPRPQTRELLEQLDRVLAVDSNHPGANHFYIHAVEAVDPSRALPMAERLVDLMPGAGHLVHMPGHIYVRVGRYRDAILANEHAVHADETYIRDQRPGLGVYTAGYYPHNYDFLAFAASMIGRSGQAMGAAEKMLSIVPSAMLRAPGMTFLQHHRTRHLQLKVRFARWDDILRTAAPATDLPHARAMWHYARGRAFAARRDSSAARSELARVRAIATDPSVAPLRLEFNTSGSVLGIAVEVLAGRLAATAGDHPSAIRHLRQAVRLEDSLTYGEPPDWTVPVRQDLGAVLLEAGRPVEAEQAFREDLQRFPENGWSLFGLARALRAQHREAEAAQLDRRFAAIWEDADTDPVGIER